MNKRNKNGDARWFTFIDGILLCLLIAGACLFYPAMNSAGPLVVTVHRDAELLARYPLQNDRSFTVEGAIGPLEICIDHGAVAVTHATCKRGICVQRGRIARPHDQIICVPNHVVIEITSSSTRDTIDAVSR